MSKRVPAPMPTRQSVCDLIEGRFSSAVGRAALVTLATRLIVEEALEEESRDAVGRDYYAHGAEPGQGYRNGVRTGRLKTAEGYVECAAPQITGRDQPFRGQIGEHLKGRTQRRRHLWMPPACQGVSNRMCE
jgi:putative transposase